MNKVSMWQLISFSRYQTKCVIKLLLRKLTDVINFKIFLGSTSKAMTGEKRGEDKNTEIWISREWKQPFRWDKKHSS